MKLQLAPDTSERVALLARAWGVTPEEAVARLVREFATSDHGPAVDADEVPIHAVYKGERVEAIFHRPTKKVTIKSGPLSGENYVAPSPAAGAVVRSIDPEVSASRNGWDFWTVTATGRTLQSLR